MFIHNRFGGGVCGWRAAPIEPLNACDEMPHEALNTGLGIFVMLFVRKARTTKFMGPIVSGFLSGNDVITVDHQVALASFLVRLSFEQAFVV